MYETTTLIDSPLTPERITVSVMERNIEITFADTEDTSLFDRLRQTLFQTYIQSLAYPH